MNDDLKERLSTQGKRVCEATLRFEDRKSKLEVFDANSRIKVRATGLKLTEGDVSAHILIADGRLVLTVPLNEAKAELEALKKDTDCLLALASLTCAEVAANSRISQ